MREYRCHVDVTDSQGREWEIEETYPCWQSRGELADRRYLHEGFALAVAKGLHEHGIFYGSTIGTPTIELIGQRQPAWDEMAAMPRPAKVILRLVK